MGEPKERILWQACTDGDLETVKKLVCDESVNVNWADPEIERTPFYRACGHGWIQIARHMMRNLRVDVMQPTTEGGVGISVASFQGCLDVVSLLLGDPRIDANHPSGTGATPISLACQQGHVELVPLLLADPRVQPNTGKRDQTTPLWFASQNGHLAVVQNLLASGREIDTRMVSLFNSKTAAEQGRLMTNAPKQRYENDADPPRRKINGPLCAALIDEYEGDPVAVRHRLRRQPGVREHFVGHLFALVVFHSDDFVVINERASSFTRRFFKITSQLPLDLQMVLCNRVFGSPRDIILSKHSEPYFKCLARSTTWQQ